MSSLGTQMPKEINRVRAIQDEYKAMRGMPNVLVDPQIAMMERDIQAGIQSTADGNVIAMLLAFEALKGWEG